LFYCDADLIKKAAFPLRQVLGMLFLLLLDKFEARRATIYFVE